MLKIQKIFGRLMTMLLVLNLLMGLGACTGTQKLSGKEKRKLQSLFKESKVFSGAFTGFALYDPNQKEYLFQKDADKYYTPASNTKILTLYTSLMVLGDSLSTIHYHVRGDSLIFWGSGYPLFLHPEIPEESLFNFFLQNNQKLLYFTDFNFQERRYGPGWAWDDYPYYYQAEKSPFPIYGNMLSFQKDSSNNLLVFPSVFLRKSQQDEISFSKWPYVKRDWDQNRFYYNEAVLADSFFHQDIPFIGHPELFTQVLGDTINNVVHHLRSFTPPKKSSLWISTPDTIYKRLMQDSDNFIAEQLLLMCADRLFDTLNTQMAIQHAKQQYFSNLPDPLQWYDGSGLSRYNLFTPRSVVKVLEKLYRELAPKRLFSIFPAGGRSGTIKNWYVQDASPYVFAKTGTLSNRHCLSGYIKTQSGNTLIFSFMHNNFVGSSNAYKKEMQGILEWIANNY